MVVLIATTLCIVINAAKKSSKGPDPKECEVCVANLEQIDKMIPKEKKSDKASIEKAIGTHCTLSGFGSEWKPNPALTSPKDVKMCYIFEPIKKSVSTPFATGQNDVLSYLDDDPVHDDDDITDHIYSYTLP